MSNIYVTSDLDLVAKAVKAKKRRKYSTETLEKLRKTAINNFNL